MRLSSPSCVKFLVSQVKREKERALLELFINIWQKKKREIPQLIFQDLIQLGR